MPIQQKNSRHLLSLRRVTAAVAVIGLLAGGVWPGACCQASESVCGDAAGDNPTSCCSRAVLDLSSWGHLQGCCGSQSSQPLTATQESLSDLPAEQPCHCQLTAREHPVAVFTKITTTVALDVLPCSWNQIGSQPCTKVVMPLAAVGFLERPLRILYGVWRN